MSKHDMFMSCLSKFQIAEGCLDSVDYCITGCDLTNLKLLQKLLIEKNIDFSLPTLIISECVLTYIAPSW